MSSVPKIIRFCFYTLFFLTPLVLTSLTSELFEFNKMVVVYALTAIILTAWVIECILQKKLVFQKTLLDLPLMLFLSSQVLSFLFSVDTHISWFGYYSRFNGGLLSTFCYSLLYWAFVTFMDRKSTEKLVNWATGAAVLVATYGILQHFGIDAKFWVQDVRNRVFSTLGQPNWLAAYLVALIWIPISKITTFKKSLIHYSVFIILFICLLFTKSRSGLLAFFISSAIYWGYTIVKTKQIKFAIILNSLFIILLLVIKTPVRDLVFSRLAIQPSNNQAEVSSAPALETGGTESGEIRKIVWKGALAIWRDGPKNFWIGTGPETFAMAYYQHRPIEHNNTSEWELLYNKAHNEYLNMLATTGLAGLASYLLVLSISGWILIKSQIANPKSQILELESWSLRLALFAGFTSIVVTNFWGFSVVITQIFLFLFPAIAHSLNTKYDIQDTKYKTLSKLQILGLCTFATLSLWTLFSIGRYWLADVHYASGQKKLLTFTSTQEAQNILDSYNEYSTAYQLNSDEPTIASDFSIAAAYISILSYEEDATSSASLAKLAETVADQAINISPTHPNYYKTKARMYLVLATVNEEFLDNADATLALAARISPTDPKIPYNRSLVAKYKGDKVAQEKFLREAVLLRPAYQSALDQFLAVPTAD